MTNSFEVVTDNSGRINYFVPNGLETTAVSPGDIAECIDGGERVVHKGIEYDLIENGSLVHPDVEVINSVLFGSGVLIGQGVKFHPSNFMDKTNTALDEIIIGSGARIEGTEIHDQVEIGEKALILARSIGQHSTVGADSRIAEGVEIFAKVCIGKAVKIDRESRIFSGATIDYAAKLGFRTIVGYGAEIGHHAKIGKFTGAGSIGVNQDGVFVRDGKVVAPYTVI